MKIYIHEGAGHYIGSAVVCLAENQNEAERLIREFLNSNGLKSEALSIRDVRTDVPGIVYMDNGDY